MDISTFFLYQDAPLVLRAPLTIAILVITGLTSYQAFNNPVLYSKLIFNPYTIQKRREWYRFLTYGLLHANWIHLGLNLFVLFGFGISVELYYKQIFGNWGSVFYIVIFI